MHPSLEHLIRLQQLETDAGERKRRLADLPTRVTDADAAVAAARAARDAVAAQIAENTAARRAADRELGVVQARLTKYKDQLMEVKTNKEYTTMQHEIATAEDGVRGFEDQILTLMMQADELTASLKAADAALAAEERKAGAVVGQKESFESYGLPWANVSNTPFRLYKHWVHEGGISTPLIASWPAVIKKGALVHEPGPPGRESTRPGPDPEPSRTSPSPLSLWRPH